VQSAADLVTKVTELVSFPDVAIQVNDMLADDMSDADAIGEVIQQDPALTATLLKLANSAMYGTGSDVDSVAKAFTRMGASEIRDLTLGICASRAFSGIPNEIISVKDYWNHSLWCGAAAKLFAKEVNARNAGMVFTAGLLHDIGHLVMFNLMPEQAIQALALCRDEMDGDYIHLAEREVFGFDHTEVGKALGELWNWPETLVSCIAYHHDPFAHPDCTEAEVLIHLSDSVATLAEFGSDDMAEAPYVDERTWERLGITPADVARLLPEIKESVSSLLQLFVH
jgi:putative nucleotidyltransferase with HDIG domain